MVDFLVDSLRSSCCSYLSEVSYSYSYSYSSSSSSSSSEVSEDGFMGLASGSPGMDSAGKEPGGKEPGGKDPGSAMDPGMVPGKDSCTVE